MATMNNIWKKRRKEIVCG